MENYVNGSDLLLSVGGKPVGHSTTHTTTFNTTTKDVAVKAAATVKAAVALFKSKRVTGLGAQIKADGLCFYKETEGGFKHMLGQWKVGASVDVACFERENDTSPYLSGKFVITTLENTAPATDDATYSVTLDNDGPVTTDETKLDLLAAAATSGS